MDYRYKIEIKWAVYYSLFLIFYGIVAQISGLHDKYLSEEQNISLLLIIPAVLTYIFCLLDERKHSETGDLNYIQSLLGLVRLSIIILILTPLVLFISYNIVSPDYFKNQINYSVSNKILSLGDAQKVFTYWRYVLNSMGFQFITGIMYSAFVPLFIKTFSKLKAMESIK
ncbi:MAG: DUF4199 domain-containing protein [Chitinophagaceae bacterium]|nr:DUF4199 domain-containing protein [Chitinophagaceae bacterium]